MKSHDGCFFFGGVASASELLQTERQLLESNNKGETFIALISYMYFAFCKLYKGRTYRDPDHATASAHIEFYYPLT